MEVARVEADCMPVGAPRAFTFYLGTQYPDWLARTDVPLFLSRRRLFERKTFPRARGPWAQDSGGFTELSMHGAWTLSAARYISETRRHAAEMGRMDFAAPQDWMCEPEILRKTGLSVGEHQRRTVTNYLDLQQRAPDVPWMPVLQGWTFEDYLRCVDIYERSGVRLAGYSRVGLGTMCRRQVTREAVHIIGALAVQGLSLHAFGFKLTGLRAAQTGLRSADSISWSWDARRSPPLPGCTRHKNCAACLPFALQWRERVLAIADEPLQLHFAWRTGDQRDHDTELAAELYALHPTWSADELMWQARSSTERAQEVS